MTRLKRLTAFIVCAGMLLLCGCGNQSETTEPVPTLLPAAGVASDVFTVFRGDVSVPTVYDASVNPYVEELYCEINAEVDEVFVHSGEEVKQGDLLISINLDSEREKAQSITETLALNAEVYAIDDEIAEAEIAILNNELLSLMQQGADETQIRLKRLDIEKAQLSLKQTQETRALETRELQAELDDLNETLAYDGIYAPFDGRVGNILSLDSGDRISAGDTLIYLVDETRLSILTEYISDRVWLYANGGAYALVGDGTYEIEYVPTDSSEYLSKVLAGNTVYTTFNITGPDNWQSEVHAGDYCAVVLLSNYYADELLIPANAVLSDAGSKYVYVVTEDGGREKRDIKVRTVGNAVYSIVTEGLEEGETIYVTDK